MVQIWSRSGQSEYGADDSVSRACDHSRDDAEIGSKLRAQHRQHEEETNEDKHSVRFQPGKRGGKGVREHAHGDASAVEWRKRKHIEDG
jgi:hypothetical protein